MRQILTIFRKDLKETLRDKRTLVVMVIVPLLLFPAIFGITTSIERSAQEGAAERTLRVGVTGADIDPALTEIIALGGMEWYPAPDTGTILGYMREDRLELGLYIKETQVGDSMANLRAVLYGEMSQEIARERLEAALGLYRDYLEDRRLHALGLAREAITPISWTYRETEPAQESIGKLVGGFLPYIFILFCYMGSMFPAIDLFTGEKERGSIETLLSAPVSRWKILVGKMMVIVLTGLMSAFLSLTGLFLSIRMITDIPQELVDIALGILTPQFVLALVGMLLPLVIFFAGIMIPATVYAKSFKEASSILQPLNFLVILPAMIGMMPGMQLGWATAFVPVLNVVLCTKELIAGTLDPGLYLVSLLSLVALASGAVAFSFRRFGDEKNVLRS